METRKEIRELHRMACPIICHYVLTSLFEMFDQAIIGQNSTRGFALVGIASVVLYGVTGALGMLSSAFHILAAEKKGKQDESGFWTVFLVSRELVIWIGCGFFILSLMFGRGLFQSIYKIRGNELRELLSYFYPASITVLENLLIFQALQKRKRRFIRSPLIRPEANIQLFGFDRTGFVRAEMIAQVRRKALPDRLSQQSGISRSAGINNGVAFIVHKRILSLL